MNHKIKIAILYHRFYDLDGNEQLIGGVETYLLNLARLCIEAGCEPIIFQHAGSPFEIYHDDIKIIGIPMNGIKRSQQNDTLYRAAVAQIDPKRDILIFGADHVSVPTNNPKTLAIQHGVSWDLPTRYFTQKKICEYGLGAKLKKYLLVRRSIRYFENCPNRVCVDYNFWNWYRSVRATETQGKIWIIPNFAAQLAEPEQLQNRYSTNGHVRILFARRFTAYRGSRIFGLVVRDVLNRFPDFTITFAGSGPDESFLHSQFACDDRVTFTKYLPDEGLEIHLKHDIAVVPSIGSEGSSFSVAEAMAAGCTVIATAVGGITNMIINEYNGLLVMPEAESLLTALDTVINSPTLRRQLGQKAYETARDTFNLVQWKKKWLDVLNYLQQS